MSRPQKQKIVRRLSQLQARPVDWLWPLRLVRGTLALLDGDPGAGKSVMTVDLAARLTTGRPLPEGSPARDPCGVVLLSKEDNYENTVVPRLQAAGGNVDRVCDFTAKTADGLERQPVFPEDCDLLAETIQEMGAGLVIIDPLAAYVSMSLGNQLIWQVVDALAQVAAQTGAVILLIRHLIKWAQGLRALMRGMGSVAIPGRARSTLLAGRHPEEEGLCLLAAPKSLAVEAPTLAYRITTSPCGQALIDWAGPVAETADDVVIAPRRDRGRPNEQLSTAMALLKEVLGHGPATYETMVRLAHASGISRRTLDRTKRELGIVSEQRQDQDGHRWYWSLPVDRDNQRVLEELFGPGFKPKSVNDPEWLGEASSQ
jgi:hypothetical protein